MQTKIEQSFYSRFDPSVLPDISFTELENIAYISKSPIGINRGDEHVLREVITKVTSAYEQRLKAAYASVPTSYIGLSPNVDTLCANSDKLDNSVRSLRSLNLEKIDKGGESVNFILGQIEEEETLAYNTKLDELNKSLQDTIDSILIEKEQRKRGLEDERNALILEIHSKLSPVLDKLDDIEVAFEDIEYLEPIYNVKRTDIVVDTELVDLREFKRLVETAHYTLGVISNKSPLSFLASILYLPAVHKFKHPEVVGSLYLAIMYLFLFVVQPYGVAVLALFFLINLFVNVFKVYDNKRIMQLAYVLARDKSGLLLKVDVIILRHPSIMSITKAIRNIDFEDTDAEIAEAVSGIEQSVRDYETHDPKDRLAEVRAFITSQESLAIIQSSLMNVVRTEAVRLEKTTAEIEGNYREHMQEIQRRSGELVKFGEMTGTEPLLDTTFSIGVKDYRNYPIAYNNFKYPNKNTLLRYDTEDEREALVNQLKLMYINTFTRIHATALVTTIFDPLKRGSDFSELFDQRLEKQLNLFDGSVTQLLDHFRDIAKNNMFLSGSKTIDEYNRESVELGRVPMEYNLVIMLTNDGTLAENQEFLSFMEYSVNNGVWFWVMDNVKYRTQNEVRLVDETRIYNLPVTITKPNFLTVNGVEQTWETPGFKPFTYDWELANFAKENYIRAVDESKITIIDYETQFRQRIVPDEKIWTFNTLDGIDMYFGFLEGDLTKPYKETLGDRTVHALMAGATGAGKSVTINQTLATMLHMYSPEWLQLVMIDFKVVEFAMYTGDYLIPHASIISGTKDGEYAVSVFDWILEEMKRRQLIFSANRVQNIRAYNRDVMSGSIVGDVMPRILVLFDEFQAMFVAVDDAKLEIIKKRISALSREARAMGVHLWFTSQSMTSTMSEDIMNQFGLRACLRVDSKDASMSILGNDAAAHLPRLGYCIVTSDPMKPQYNRLCKIPLISDSTITEYLTKIINKTHNDIDSNGKHIPHVHRNASFYREDVTHDAKELYDWYDQPTLGLGDDETLFLLGEQMSFSDNALPVNIKLNREDGQNICFCGFNRNDTCNFLATILDNIKCHSSSPLIAATIADEEVASLIGIKDLMNEGSIGMSGKNEVDRLAIQIFQLIELREKEGADNEETLYYFIIGADKYGDDKDYNIWEVIMPQILRRGPVVGIHVVIYSRTPRPLRVFSQSSNYLCCTQTTETNSSLFVDNLTAARIPDDTCYMRYGTEDVKFKLYQHVFDESKIKATEAFVSRASLQEIKGDN